MDDHLLCVLAWLFLGVRRERIRERGEEVGGREKERESRGGESSLVSLPSYNDTYQNRAPPL